MPLSHPEARHLHSALLEAFPTHGELKQFVFYYLGQNLNAISGEGNLEDKIFDLILSMDARGEIYRLVFALWRVRPGNPNVQPLLEAGYLQTYRKFLMPFDEVDSLLKLLSDLSVDRIWCQKACAELGLAKSSGDFEEVVVALAAVRPRSELPVLVRFVHHLAKQATDDDAREQLITWVQGHAVRTRLSQPQVTAHWEQLERIRIGGYCLMVVLEDEGTDLRIRAWLCRENEDTRGLQTLVRLDREQFPRAELAQIVQSLLENDPVAALLNGTGETLLAEFIVSLDRLIPGEGPLLPTNSPFSEMHDVVLRCYERVYQFVKPTPFVIPGEWKRRWNICQKEQRGKWVRLSSASADLQQELSHEYNVALALRVHPADLSPDQHKLLIKQALWRGLPVMTWVAGRTATSEDLTVISRITQAPPQQVREKIREIRRPMRPTSKPRVRHIELLWDNPDRLPPDAYKKAELKEPS